MANAEDLKSFVNVLFSQKIILRVSRKGQNFWASYLKSPSFKQDDHRPYQKFILYEAQIRSRL